jgi:uncharacterized protein
MRIWFPFLLLLAAAAPVAAQNFPKLSGRVVDAANIIPDEQEPALAQKLEALEKASSRQLVVATIPDLQGYPIEDYGYQLGRAWAIGQKGANNGVILLVAPNERRVRIEVGYGLEPIMPDSFANRIIEEKITPAFKQGDYPGGINAGADAIIEQLQAPPEQAEQRVLEAQQAQQAKQGRGGNGGGSLFPLIFWGIVLLFVVLPMLRGRRGGRRYRRGGLPVVIWGPGLGGWGGGSHSSGWGGGGGGWSGGGGGGFSGGGGSFGGGGASGSW